MFKLRKTPYLLIVYIGLVFCLGTVHNPYQYAVVHNVWFWILGLVSLIYLAYIERQRNIPFQFMNAVEPKVYYGAYLFIAFGLSIVITRVLGLIIYWVGFPVYYIVVQSSNDVFGIIGYSITVAVNEESFKVALTNFCTKIFGRHRKGTQRRIVLTIGTVSVALWAYLHILVGGHNIAYALITFVTGMVYFITIYYAKNYLPTTAAHATWNAAVDFGFLQ